MLIHFSGQTEDLAVGEFFELERKNSEIRKLFEILQYFTQLRFQFGNSLQGMKAKLIHRLKSII